MIGRLRLALSAALVGIALAATSAKPERLASGPAPDWHGKASDDLSAMAEAIRATDINAVYPDPARWRHDADDALLRVRSELPLVCDERGYRAVLQHFAASFQDAHVHLEFLRPDPAALWPGFVARYQDGRYLVALSDLPDIADGTVISACDGRPVAEWEKAISRYEIGLPPHLETTRASSALRLLVDRGSPLRPRPVSCTVGGREVPLAWRIAEMDQLAPRLSALRGRRAAAVGTRLLDDGGAWVTLGYFEPQTSAQADAFRAAVAAAANLRDRRYVVLDVRGNGGGPYNWLMSYLRGLYGPEYADWHATARLRIAGVYRLLPSAPKPPVEPAGDVAVADPPDPPFEVNEAANENTRRDAAERGAAYWQAAAIPHERDGAGPPNLVRGQVYVLTDTACGSACIGFVDELKLFPGVKQIGAPTHVDSHTGTPVPTLLPGGEVRVSAPMMTRDGRMRNDNDPQVPEVAFHGDITDDVAVQRWVEQEVAKRR